jgi:hydrogenase maturation factor
MNLIYGEIVDVFSGPEPRLGKVRVCGAMKIIPLDLLTDPTAGDKVLLCDGVAIGKVDEGAPKEKAYVPGHTR